MAGQAKANVDDSTVGSRVSIGKDNEGGFQLAVELEVTLPHLDKAEAQALADKAHKVCPYSNATRGNITVTLSIVD